MIYPQNFEQKIGFEEIRTLLTGHCLSTLGIERVGQMKFLTDLHLLRELQEQTREFLRIQEEEEDFPEQDFYDVRPAIKRIRIEGTYLDETELFDLKRSLCTIINIVRFLNKDTEEDNGTEENRPGDDASVPYPALRRLTQGVSVYPQLVRRIESILDKYGKIKDSASAELLRIRRELVAAESGIFAHTARHLAERSTRRRGGQGCHSHHARRTLGHSRGTGFKTENKRNRPRRIRHRAHGLHRTGRSGGSQQSHP